MNLRLIDWIWHIRGSIALAPGESRDEVFARLDPLFQEHGTSHERTNDKLTFRKKDQAAQDKMSIFDSGILQIENGASGPILRYRLASRILLLCFLAPLLFLSFAQLTVTVGKLKGPETAAEKAKEKKDDEFKKAMPQNPVDRFLGAPAPDRSMKKDKGKEKDDGKKDRFSPIPAYVFAGIFAALYVLGRFIEDRLVKALFRKRLSAASLDADLGVGRCLEPYSRAG